jgi:hypothetical protein
MTSSNLANLARIGKLKPEQSSPLEIARLIESGRNRVKDAKNEALSLESRFDLAYNASHALALAALRWHGYRSDNRYLVFQSLPFTLGMAHERWRIFALCHERRNIAEYEGFLNVEDRLLADLVELTEDLLCNVEALVDPIE